MSKNKKIKQIAISTKKLGDTLTDKYYSKNNIDNAKEAIRAYNVSLKAHILLIKLNKH